MCVQNVPGAVQHACGGGATVVPLLPTSSEQSEAIAVPSLSLILPLTSFLLGFGRVIAYRIQDWMPSLCPCLPLLKTCFILQIRLFIAHAQALCQ